jgi:hypothetical protein
MTTGEPGPRTEINPKLLYTLRVAAYFVLLAAINFAAFDGVPYLASLIVSSSADSAFVFLLAVIGYLLGTLGLTWGFCRLDRDSLVDLGLHRPSWLARTLWGWALGATLVLLVFTVFWMAGWVAVERMSPPLLTLAASVLAWILISFVEELTFRGYILQYLVKGWGMPIAVLASSILFGLVHSLNPEANALGIFNIVFAGGFFAAGYLVTRSLWFASGLHMGWNLTLIHLLGFAGSGYTEPSLLQSTVDGPVLLTGGAFGPEGGLVGLGAWLLGIALLLGYWMVRLREKERGREK